jgi:hypothetical protein
MSDAQTTQSTPKPIAAVLRYHAALQVAFVRHRAAQDKCAAFVDAVADVMPGADGHQLFELIAGSYNAAYDAQRGSEFGRILLDELEQSYQDVRQLEAQTRRWEHMDALATVEALTTDADLATLFVQTVDEHDDATARVLVSTAVQTVVDKAAAARTGIGKRRTLERARTTLEQRTAVATGSSADDLAGPRDVALASWTDAIFRGLVEATTATKPEKSRV